MAASNWLALAFGYPVTTIKGKPEIYSSSISKNWKSKPFVMISLMLPNFAFNYMFRLGCNYDQKLQ